MILPDVKIRFPLLRNLKFEKVLQSYLERLETAHVGAFRDLRTLWGRAIDFPALSEAVLSVTEDVDMQTAAKTTLLAVPSDKKALVTGVLVYAPSASLAGGTVYNFGSGAACTTWKQSVNLSTLTASTLYMMITGNNTAYTILNAGDAFGIYPSTGSTLAATATLCVLGREYNA